VRDNKGILPAEVVGSVLAAFLPGRGSGPGVGAAHAHSDTMQSAQSRAVGPCGPRATGSQVSLRPLIYRNDQRITHFVRERAQPSITAAPLFPDLARECASVPWWRINPPYYRRAALSACFLSDDFRIVVSRLGHADPDREFPIVG
jgi:hypothetical protein